MEKLNNVTVEENQNKKSFSIMCGLVHIKTTNLKFIIDFVEKYRFYPVCSKLKRVTSEEKSYIRIYEIKMKAHKLYLRHDIEKAKELINSNVINKIIYRETQSNDKKYGIYFDCGVYYYINLQLFNEINLPILYKNQ